MKTLGISVKEDLLERVEDQLTPLEINIFLSVATILDPRFKHIHFTSPIAVSNAISKISNDIHLEHRHKGHALQCSSNSRKRCPLYLV